MAIDNSFLVQKVQHQESLIAAFCGLTNMPFAVCDPETYNDQVWVFEEEQYLQEFAKPYTEKKVPLRGITFKNSQFLGFFSSLYTMGINEVVFVGASGTTKIELENLVTRPNMEKVPESQRPIENPPLQLTGMYFLQEFGRPVPNEEKQNLRQLDEEFSVNLARARYIVAIQPKEGPGSVIEKIQKREYSMPIVTLKNGDAYQPLFTDMLEFTKFKGKADLQAIGVPFSALKNLMVKTAKGFMLNPAGFHILMQPALLDAVDKNFPDAVKSGEEHAKKLAEEMGHLAASQAAARAAHKAPSAKPQAAPDKVSVPFVNAPLSNEQAKKISSKITSMPSSSKKV